MSLENEEMKEINYNKSTQGSIWITFAIIFGAFVAIMAAIIMIFAYINSTNENIVSGVFIKGINVSGMNKEEANQKLNNMIVDNMSDEILLHYGEFETSIAIEQIDASFDIASAVERAYGIGKEGNVFENTFKTIAVMVSNINIEPTLSYNKEQLRYALEDISTKLPDTVIQSSCYIDGTNLVITKGKAGSVVDVDKMEEIILEEIKNVSYSNNVINIEVYTGKPTEINVESIYSQVRKDPVDAYYTIEPYSVHPHENGVDFNISIDEVKEMLKEDKEEYIVPLKIITPGVTTNMIGTEAFPNQISTFYTKYNASNRNRTTNLQLAAGKINGTVIMPGEEFSYNKIVGKRTIDAGYKEAAMYSEGEVTDGLGGGICQISSTLYNAVLYANLEITERRNHQFIPSYVGAGRDATVVYGSTDFKFKNTREYPIKIVAYVSGGTAKFEIYGMWQEGECEIDIQTVVKGSIPYSTKYVTKAGYKAGRVVQKGVNGTKSETYRIRKVNGEIVSRELLSKDTYNAMNKLITK